MPTPAHQSSTGHTGNPTTSATVTLPTTAANDILIAVGVNGGATAALSTPGGTYSGGAWSLIAGGAGTAQWGGVWWSRATGDHSGQTVVFGTATDSCSAGVMRVSGCLTTASPIDTNVSSANITANGLDLAAFTTTGPNELVVFCSAADDNIAYSGQTMGGNAMTERLDASSTGGLDSGVMFATLAQAAAGTTGAFAGTHASTLSKRLVAFALKAPPLTATANQASETDTAGVMGRTKTLAIGQASDSETAAVTGRKKTLVVAQAVDIETAGLTGTRKTLAIGRAVDTETAAVVTPVQTGGGQTIAVGQAVDTETAGAITSSKRLAIAQAVDTETAQALTAIDPILRTLGQAVDTEVAGTTTPTKKLAIAQAVDTETAQALTAIDPILRAIAQVSDTETAGVLASTKGLAIAQVSDTEIAAALAVLKTGQVQAVTDTEIAAALTLTKSASVGQATDTEVAQALDVSKVLAIGRASELDSALAIVLAGSGIVPIEAAVETNSASPLESGKVQSLGVATDLETALALVARKVLALAMAAESDTAAAITSERAATISQAVETSEASGLLVFTAHTVGQALESNTAGLVVLVLPDPEEEEADVVLFSITPDMSGFEEAQQRLRSMMGVDISFYWPTVTEWPADTPLNPETGRPFDPTVTPTASGYASASVRCSVVHRPVGGAVEDQQESTALARMDAKNVGLIMNYGAFPSAATEFEWLDRRYKIVDHLSDALSTARRDLAFGEMM